MDISSRDDINSQQSSHVVTPPSQKVKSKPAPKSPLKASQDSRVDFERRMMFNSALEKGKTPEAAAQYAGVKMDSGDSLNSTQIMDLKFRGTAPKTRKRL